MAEAHGELPDRNQSAKNCSFCVIRYERDRFPQIPKLVLPEPITRVMGSWFCLMASTSASNQIR